MKGKVFSALGIALLLGLLAAVPALANGPKKEFVKTISREFNTTANGMTALYNKHGKITVNTWETNKVKIEISIVVNAADERSAERTFSRINVNFANAAGYVKAETVIEAQKAVVWVGNEGSDFKINYEVWMPVGNQLDLKNKYGNTYIGDLNGKLSAEIKYGDLRTERIANDAELYIGYGNASLNEVNNLYGQLSYGSVKLLAVKDMQIESKYSEIKVDKAVSIRVISKYDDFNLGRVDDLRVQTKYADIKVAEASAAFLTAQYTDVVVDKLRDHMDADMSYGSLKVKQLGRDFSKAKVLGQYTDVVIMVDASANYQLMAEGYSTGVKYPPAMRVTDNNKSGATSSVKGYVGSNNAKSVIFAKMKYGDLVIRND